MEKDNIQKELFNEFEAPKKQPRRFGQFFQKTDFTISLSAEKLVFVSIGITMLLVVSFALGVEKGKATSKCVEAKIIPAQTQVSTVQVKTVNTVTNVVPKDRAQASTAKSVPVAPQGLSDKSKPYTIVAAAFSKEVFATQEVSHLKAIGLDAFIIKGDPYYLACVGSFANKDAAKTILNKIKQMHKDAYVRLR